MKKVITALIIILLTAVILILFSIDDLNRRKICLVFDISGSENKDLENSFCKDREVHVKGLGDKRFHGEKGSDFRWMSLDSGGVKCFFGLYSLTVENDTETDKQDDLKIHETSMHDIEKPSFPDVEADIVAVILKVEGNSELLEEKIEEVFLHFQSDFRQPDIFYIYGAKIPERINLLNNAEIIYLYNKPEIIVTDLTLIRSDTRELYLKNNGTKRIPLK